MVQAVADVENNVKLSKSDALAQLKILRKEYTNLYKQLSSAYCDESTISSLMEMRGYDSQEMYETLKEIGVIKMSYLSDISLVTDTTKFTMFNKFGLIDKNGNYLLADRYVVPIRDIVGDVTALVGWYPDTRKYVTTPTWGFSKDSQFFNIETAKNFEPNSSVYLVEGIFDTLALRSIGLFALGNMGLGLSPIKKEILTRFGHVYAIPDADKAGKGVLPYTSTSSQFKWNISNATFVELKLQGVKDTDDLVKFFDCKEDLTNLSTNYIERIVET